MAQKNYKAEIINALLKNPSHIRRLAISLDTNHMMIHRKINGLFKENVVDYNQEGKNKVYFLKKSIEAKEYVFMAERYNLLQVLKKYPPLRSLIEKIQKNREINLSIIFGSYAKLTAKKDSDIDIYIETTDRKIKKELENIDSKLSIKIGKYDRKSHLIKELEKNHVIIKGVERFYEKTKFFE